MQIDELRKSGTLVGVFWMVVSGLCFVGVTAIVKFLGTAVPPAQSAFLRYLLGLVFIIPVLKEFFQTNFTKEEYILFAVRGVFHTVGVICWFYAMTEITIAEVTSLNYLTPVFLSLAAIMILGESLSLRRMMAIFIALFGTLLILRPGFRELSPGHLAMMVTVVSFTVSYLIAKKVTGRLNPEMIITMLSLTVTVGLFPIAAVVWIPPTNEQLFLLFLVAFFATAGHYTMTKAFYSAPVTATQPVTFLQLVWATMLGTLLFAEPIDLWVMLGGTIIIGSVTFLAWREAVYYLRSKTK
ncbi:MAG: DMT family transporter [Rhodobacteraceae bacterium]|nr:DMT family transporter [Paracoccaceae bacterium]